MKVCSFVSGINVINYEIKLLTDYKMTKVGDIFMKFDFNPREKNGFNLWIELPVQIIGTFVGREERKRDSMEQ